MIRIPFTKVQGTGNDFLILEASPELPLPSERWRRRLCDRRYGVGADGILFLSVPAGSPKVDAELRLFNSDGGEAEISGNGTRCAAAYLIYTGRGGTQLTIQTKAGRKTLTRISQQENQFTFEMAMGSPVFSPALIPFQPAESAPEPIVGFPLPLASGPRPATITSMGNPHCSVAVENFDWDWKSLGAEIERHPFFPNRTNVEFYRVVSDQEIEVRYWERGVGVTLSSGTGSCAAAIAAILNQKARSPLTVKTLGGNLGVRWDSEGVFLTGPAEIIFRGEFFGGEEPDEFPATIPQGI